MTEWIVKHLGLDVPVHFTAFHPDWKMLNTPPTPATTLTKARSMAVRNGIRYALMTYKGQPVVVYAVPRGGVVLGVEIARALEAPLDLIVVRKTSALSAQPDTPRILVINFLISIPVTLSSARIPQTAISPACFVD